MVMMTTSPVRQWRFAMALALVLALGGAGCRKRPAQNAPSTPLPTTQSPTTEMPPPEITGTPEKTPPALTVPAPSAPRPRPNRRTSTSAPAETAPPDPEAAVSKPEPPRISPRYSAQEEAAFRKQTNESIAEAERNLQRMNRRKLNPAQADMAEKIRGFLAQAHEAISAGDWFRAQNLAGKASVLSAELIRSR